MKTESGAEGITYDYFSTNGQMARELKRSIKEKARLALALELLAAVNRDAWDRGKRGELSGPGTDAGEPMPQTFRPLADKLPLGHQKELSLRQGRFMRTVIWCENHKRKEFRLRRI